MNNLKVLGKFLDQPILVSKLQKAMPIALTALCGAYTAYDASKAEEGKKKQRAVKTGLTLGSAAAAAIAAPYIASAITKRPRLDSVKIVKNKNKEIVDTFVKSSNLEKNTKEILEKSKKRILKFKEVKTLYNDIAQKQEGKEFLGKLIPSPNNINSKDIFSEIGYLSIYGAVPIAGGIAGGIASDKIYEKDWKKNVPNKIKEGAYQYLANIFMCNIGAGAALGILEKAGIKSKRARALGMTAGIALTGILGGSKIANFIGGKIIDPICSKISKTNEQTKANSERTPEILDIGLHTDDIATVSLLSGLKWIEPVLPAMYTLSGYRAGIGYRN